MAVGVTTITIEWNEVECAHRNGDITSYSVRYGPSSTPSSDRSVEKLLVVEHLVLVRGK